VIIPAQEIRRRQIFKPFHSRTVHPNGKSFGLSAAGYDVRVAERVRLKPGEFSLASTVEHFTMPADLLGIVHDKSTWARMGLALQNTVIEPGWRGHLTLELTNHSPNFVDIEAGEPIAQIVLHLLSEPTNQPYTGKYQDQEQGPQAARFEKPVKMQQDSGGW
jgi:dCTP deaminase